MKNNTVLKSSFVALGAALICFSCIIKIPFGIVPLAFQNMFCILIAALFGGVLGFLPTVLFVGVGALGFPVFSGGVGGLPVLLGPTGGFILGYVFGAIFTSLIVGKCDVCNKSIFFDIRLIFGIIIGFFLIYVPGVLWFCHWIVKTNAVSVVTDGIYGSDFFSVLIYSLSASVLPFLPGDIIKICLCILFVKKLRPSVAAYFGE
jgi:biotin transport system substrate-specific component